MLEKDIVVAIRRYLGTLGDDVFFWKESGGPYGTSGVPDIICCYKGRFLGLEAIVRVMTHPALRDKPFYLETPNELDGYAREIALLKERCA